LKLEEEFDEIHYYQSIYTTLRYLYSDQYNKNLINLQDYIIYYIYINNKLICNYQYNVDDIIWFMPNEDETDPNQYKPFVIEKIDTVNGLIKIGSMQHILLHHQKTNYEIKIDKFNYYPYYNYYNNTYNDFRVSKQQV
jgi:hypothetical protein